METLRMLANTQYNDLQGKINIDGHEGNALKEFAEWKGIDTEEYFPIGLSYNKEEYSESLIIYAVNVAFSYDELRTYLAMNPGPLPVQRFPLESNLNEYLGFIKRLSFVVSPNEEILDKNLHMHG